MLRVPLFTILTREMRFKFFEVDQRLEMLRVPLVTILAREMRLTFFEVNQRLEMLRVPLVTIFAREMRLTFFEVDQALEIMRVPLVTILAREIRLKLFEVDRALEILRVPLFTILAREMRLKIFWSRPSFGDVASAASHDICSGLKIFWSRPSFGDVASAARREKCDWKYFQLYLVPITWPAVLGKSQFFGKMSIFNHIYCANIVTSGPRSTSKASFVEKLSIAFLAPTSWLAALAPDSLRGLHVSIAYPSPISWRPCSQSHVKHVLVSTAMALKRSSTSCGWFYSQSRE